MPKTPSKLVSRPATKNQVPDSAIAASFLMGTAGMPAGLDPANAGKAKPGGAYGTPATAVIGSQDVAVKATAGDPGTGSDVEELVRRSNFWRDNYNPLRGLTIARLLALFEQAERGAFSEIQLTLRKAEKRFPILKGFVEKLLSSIEELDGKVRVKEQLPEGATPAMAEAQRKFLQARYDLLQNFKSSVAQIALADVRGYAVLQKHRFQGGTNDGAVRELYWLEPWCWARDGFYGDFYYNENSQFGVGLGSCSATLGEDNRIGSRAMPREEFVVREAESPLYEIALIAFVGWLMGRKDYAAFTEIFGLPNCIVIMPANVPPGKELEYKITAEKAAKGISGAMPNGTDVKFPTSQVRGSAPFEDFCGAQEKDLVLAGTGGVLTMISQPTGIGKGASEEHDAAWQKIAIQKARRVNEALQRDFDLPELAAEFPGQPVCVYFSLDVKDTEDVSTFLDNVVKGVGLGYKPDLAEVSERSGIKFEEAPEPEPGPGETDPDDPLFGDAAKADLNQDKRDISGAVRNRRSTALRAALAADLAEIGVSPAQFIKVLNGGQSGHPFYGNQYTAAISQINDVLSGKKDEAAYASVSPDVAAKIKAATGKDVSGYQHFVDHDALVHIDRQHGVGREDQKGQSPVTKDDIQKIPEIVAQPDSISAGGKSKRGLPTIVYAKRFNGTTYYVEEQWLGQKLLAAKTMYKEAAR